MELREISWVQLEGSRQAHRSHEVRRALVPLAFRFPVRNGRLMTADHFRERLLREPCTLAGFAQDFRDIFTLSLHAEES